MSETPTKKKAEALDLPAIMAQARDQYTAEREKVLAERKQFDDRLAEIDAELFKIEAYFNPAPPAAVQEPPVRRTPATRAPRKAGVRDEILAKIAEHPDGISRKDLLAAMGADTKNAEQSVSNAVAALTKEGKITAPTKGHYKAI